MDPADAAVLNKEIEEAKAAVEAAKAAEAAKKTAISGKKVSPSKTYVPVKRVVGQSMTYLVFQGDTYNEERTGQFIWAPKYTKDGRRVDCDYHMLKTPLKNGATRIKFLNIVMLNMLLLIRMEMVTWVTCLTLIRP